MELQQILKVLLRWWWLVALPILVVVAYLGLTYQPPSTSYQVVLRFATGTEPPGVSLDYDRYYPWLTSEYIANGLADIARTGAFAQAVAARAQVDNVNVPPAAIQSAIVTDNAQSVMVLYMTWSNPEELTTLALAASEELTQNGPTYYPQMKNTGSVAQRLDEPIPTPMPPSLKARLVGPGLRLALAGSVGLALAFLAHYLDPVIHERSEVEMLGVPILMEIPRKHRTL